MNTPWLFAGGAAAAGLIASGWSYVRSLSQYIMSWLIITITVKGYQSDAMQLYLRNHFEASKYGPRLYTAWLMRVRSLNRTQLVSMEVIGNGGRLFWQGWRPIWVAKSTKSNGEDVESGVTARDYDNNSLTITFPRGLFKADELVADSADFYNRSMVGFDEDGQPQTSQQRRHYVRYIFGTAGKPMGRFQSGSRASSPSSGTDTRACRHHRPIAFDFDDLGSEESRSGSPLDDLALNADSLRLVEEARFWRSNEEWYRGRNIPWRRGVLLYGPPGTGKTALIRAIAEDLDLPVFIFDLGSMFNEELQVAWSNMLSEVPCMAVIEDIDAVFHGRENVVSKEQQSLTFDCFLNCLDGIQRSNGLFLAITTNHPDKIDPALGRPDQRRSSRPGRIDRAICLGPLEEEARTQIAARILPDRIDQQFRAVYEGEGDTAAQFQERCAQMALAEFWAKADEGPSLMINR